MKMGFFSRLSNAYSAFMRGTSLSGSLFMNTATESGVSVSHDSALAVPAIFQSVRIISQSMLKVPFYVFKVDESGSQDWDKKHEAWTAVHRKANPFLLAPLMRETMTAWALLYGNAVAYVDRSIPGQIQIIPFVPDRTTAWRVTEAIAKETGIPVGTIYFQTVIDGKTYSYEASECIHIRGLGMSPYWGTDIVTTLREAIGGANAASKFGYKFYGQGTTPAGFVEMPSGLSETAQNRFIESVKRASSGLSQSHKLAVLEEGSKFQPWAINPEDAQFLEGKEFDIRVLAMVVGIKVHKLIDSANSSYNSLEMSNQEHKEDDLLPWYRRWSIEYNDKLLTEKENMTGSHEIGIDDEQMEWSPFADRSKGVVELYNNGVITKDEARRRVNFGRSKSKHASDFRRPANIVLEDEENAAGIN